MADVLGYDRRVLDLIRDFSTETGIFGDLITAVAYGESALDVNAEGDGGRSVGLIQIHVPAHGGPPEKWKGLDGARRSLQQMKERWLRELRKIPNAADLWRSGPTAFLTMAWPMMQGADAAAVRRRAAEVAREGRAIWAAYVAAPEPGPSPDPDETDWAQAYAALWARWRTRPHDERRALLELRAVLDARLSAVDAEIAAMEREQG